MSSIFSKMGTFSAIRLLAGIATLLIIMAYQYLPKKTIPVLPNPQYKHTIYLPPRETANPTTIDTDETVLTCEFKQSDMFSCGMSFAINNEKVEQGINLQNMEGLIVNLKYTGQANTVRIFLRNYNPEYSGQDIGNRSKYLSTLIRSSDFNQDTFLKLTEFSVGDWWIKEFKIPRQYAAPEFSNVITIGFDFIDLGTHDIQIEKVEIVGAWISREQLYLIIIVLWMLIIIWEGVSRVATIYLAAKRSNQKIIELAERYKELEIEKKEFENLSTTDPLTGITNRAGIEKFVGKIFESSYETSNLGIILFDIDYFKRINDTRGHDAGDRVLEALAKLISMNLREVDIFGRWGGEEFIIITPQTTGENLEKLAEKIRACVSANTFEPERPLQVTISIGVTTVKPDEKFERALKKADMALYEAKNQGRNCVMRSQD